MSRTFPPRHLSLSALLPLPAPGETRSITVPLPHPWVTIDDPSSTSRVLRGPGTLRAIRWADGGIDAEWQPGPHLADDDGPLHPDDDRWAWLQSVAASGERWDA